MLYEVRAYTFTAGDAGEAVEDFGRIIDERRKLSPLVCFFQAEVGELNRILHIWEYEDSAHRERVRAEAQAKPWWPPLRVEKILHQQTRLMRAAPFCPKPLAGDLGSIYEIRSDTVITGGMKNLAAEWAKHLPEREKLSPLAAAFSNQADEMASGILNEFLHIWPYRDYAHRAEVAEAASRLPGWRDCEVSFLKAQISEIWVPVPYSPMH